MDFNYVAINGELVCRFIKNCLKEKFDFFFFGAVHRFCERHTSSAKRKYCISDAAVADAASITTPLRVFPFACFLSVAAAMVLFRGGEAPPSL